MPRTFPAEYRQNYNKKDRCTDYRSDSKYNGLNRSYIEGVGSRTNNQSQ